MNNDLLSLLGALSSTPNWQYGLGVQQLGPQYQSNAYNYQLGQSQLANQLAEFQAQQALAAAQQQWQQQFQTTGQQQQFGLQSQAQTAALAQQQEQQALQQAMFPTLMAQMTGLIGGSGGAGPRTGAISGGANNAQLPSGTSGTLAIRPGISFNPALAAINPSYSASPMFNPNQI